MTKKKTPLTDDSNFGWQQLELGEEFADDTYDAYTGYALLAGTELPPVLREDEQEI